MRPYDEQEEREQLISIERFLAQVALDYANGNMKPYIALIEETDPSCWDSITEAYEAIAWKRIRDLYGSVPAGFFINWDPRGHQLKCDPEHAPNYNLRTDWGGNGLLAPDAYDDEHGGSI